MSTRALSVSPTQLDFHRAKLLEANRHLCALICTAPFERDFSRHPNRTRLEQLQSRMDEMRLDFITKNDVGRIDRIAADLPRLDDTLARAAAACAGGWVTTSGRVQRFAVDNPELVDDEKPFDGCHHGKRFDERCERCDADHAELDRL